MLSTMKQEDYHLQVVISSLNKKKMETLVWVDEPYAGFQVDFIIKKEILSDSKSHGIIYIDGNERSIIYASHV